jgi:hypothetical protein
MIAGENRGARANIGARFPVSPLRSFLPASRYTLALPAPGQ